LLKKEISLSGLFRRGGGAPEEAKPAKPPKQPKQEKQPKQPKQPKQEKQPKQPKAKQPKEPKQPKAQRAPKAAPPLAQVPIMRAFNLLPKDDSRAKRTGSNTGVIAVVVGAVLVVAALGALYFQSSAAVSHKQSQVTELQAKLAAINVKPETPREKIAPQLQTEQSGRTTALATALSGRIAWDRILREISLVLPDDISLTQVQTTSLAAADATQPSVTQIEFDGFAPTQASVGLMLSRLALIPEVASVELVRSDGSANSANQTGPIFQVHVTLKPGIATAGASPGGTA